MRVLRHIVRDEGNYKALYRGLMPNMVGNSVSWALYFLWYVAGPIGQLMSAR
jgi:solute carrier family 25 (mitochondrial folate transporter), member 32